jgi:polar amino acid transport system permease protein
MNTIFSQALFIAQGLKVSFVILLGGLGIGVSLGTLFSILRYNKIGSFVIDFIISLFRGTPLILQLSFFYFIIPQIFGIRFDVLSTGILTFGLNSSAYVAEIIRAGIESVPRGQFEAAMTLQISNFYMWKDIILPQVIKNVLPALANEVISLLKESALISTIGGMDIMKKVNIITAQQMSYFTPLCIAGLYYYGLVMLITMLSSYFETKDHHA